LNGNENGFHFDLAEFNNCRLSCQSGCALVASVTTPELHSAAPFQHSGCLFCDQRQPSKDAPTSIQRK
jgi:hypothetical protein